MNRNQWEYKVLTITRATWTMNQLMENIQTQLNEAGRDGWELVTNSDHILIMKRLKA